MTDWKDFDGHKYANKHVVGFEVDWNAAGTGDGSKCGFFRYVLRLSLTFADGIASGNGDAGDAPEHRRA